MYSSSNRVIEAFTSLLSGLTLWFFIVASLAAFFLLEITSDELPAIIDWCHYLLGKVIDLLDRSCVALENFDRWFNRINTPPDLKDNPFSATVQVFYTWCMLLLGTLPASAIVVTCLGCILYIIDRETFFRILVSQSETPRLSHRLLLAHTCGTLSVMSGVALIETLWFVSTLAHIWSSEISLWTANTRTLILGILRRLSGVHFYQKYLTIKSERLQYQQELDALRQETVGWMCKFCHDASANIIVIACGHMDLCTECLHKMDQHNGASQAPGECPEYEARYRLHGTIHTHCLVCRAGGKRRKVFFA